MSIKRSSLDRGMTRRPGSDDGGKVDRQDFWDELTRRAQDNEPFAPQDIAQTVGASEAVVSKHLLTLALERLVEKVDGGRYRAGPIAGFSQAEFIKAMNARIDPKRQQDLLEVERLKKNNDEMRRRLFDAMADRDRLRTLLEKHGIDPTEAP